MMGEDIDQLPNIVKPSLEKQNKQTKPKTSIFGGVDLFFSGVNEIIYNKNN